MAKGKKRRSKRPAPRVSEERLEALRSALGELGPEDVTGAEFEALVDVATRDEPESARSAVGRLDGLTGGDKRRLKALRRGLHRLRQRGVETDDLAIGEAPGGIRIHPDRGVGGGLPVLLAPVGINAVRRMTFGLARGPGVVLVEAVFKARELFRLVAAPSNRVAYRRWARQMCATDGGLPERVGLSPEWLERKLWEVGRFAAAGKLGTEVDRGLLEHLQWPRSAPPHPALALQAALGDVEPLGFAELVEQPRRLDAFYHGSALGALRQQWYELGGDASIEPSSAAAAELRDDMHGPVRDWATQWGSETIIETLLDLASFHEAVGDHRAARTFVELGARREEEQSTGHDNRIHRFLVDVALWQLKGGPTDRGEP